MVYKMFSCFHFADISDKAKKNKKKEKMNM